MAIELPEGNERRRLIEQLVRLMRDWHDLADGVAVQAGGGELAVELVVSLRGSCALGVVA